MRNYLYELIDIYIQKKVFKTVHSGKSVNSFEPWNTPDRRICDNGHLYISDLCYGTKVPNSFFDIRYPNEDTAAKRPTLVYFHGGGFLFGDKSGGDPLAAGTGGVGAMLSKIVDSGYNVVTANYAFAPKYRFPVQLDQVDQLMAHLKVHPEYGLDMENVVLMGSSAGANLTAIYGLMVADKEYADKIGIQPCITGKELKALVIDEMVLNPAYFNTGLKILCSAWLDGSDPKRTKNMQLANVALQFRGKYLPAFLIASNAEPAFLQCAQEMKVLLDAQSLENAWYYVSKEEAGELPHGFMSNGGNSYAEDCFVQTMAFIAPFVGL